jgi:hypothetical protein
VDIKNNEIFFFKSWSGVSPTVTHHRIRWFDCLQDFWMDLTVGIRL